MRWGFLIAALALVIMAGIAWAQGYGGCNLPTGGGTGPTATPTPGGGITYVGGTVNNWGSGQTTFTISYPAGQAAGQVAYIFVDFFPGTSSSPTATATGWTLIYFTPANFGTSVGLGIMRRVLDGTEGPSVSVTVTNNTAWFASMRVYSGVNTTTPEDSVVSGGNPVGGSNNTGQPSTATTQPAVSSFTTTTSGDMLVAYAYDWNAKVTLTTPTGFSNALLDNASAASTSQGSWDMTQATAGSTGTITSGGVTSGNSWLMAILALKPH